MLPRWAASSALLNPQNFANTIGKPSLGQYTRKRSSRHPRASCIDGLTTIEGPRGAPHLTQSASGVPQECGSGYVTDGMVIEVWTRRDVKGRSHAARIGTDAVTHGAGARQTLVLWRAGVP